LANLGARSQEAFQLLQNGSGIAYAVTYLVMFAIPFVLPGSSLWLRIASASGFLMTLLYVVLSVFPIIDVANRALFTTKISGLLVGLNLAGVLFFRRAGRIAKSS